MNPLSYARRGARWLMAAGIAVAMLAPAHGFAEDAAPAQAGQTITGNPQSGGIDYKLELDSSRIINPEPGGIVPFFTKTGGQRGCDYVVYTLTFGLRGNPQGFAGPGLATALKAARLDFRDQLPHGLRIVGVHVSGDGTDAAGGPLPAAATSTSAGPDDTATVADFRISPLDLDGLGVPNERTITFQITASIDHAAFPAPVTVDNQGTVKVTAAGGAVTTIPSQDPGQPDDGNILTGVKTSIRIDVTRCNPPPPPPGKECFKVERGTVDCVPGGGAFIYHMPVGPQMGGKWVQVSTTTPGITIVPATQQVPMGGGVLDWKIIGASPGETIHLVVTGIDTYGGPREGWGLCCTQTIDIVIPRDLRCPPRDKEPDLKVEKRADVPRCTMAGGCDFTITVTNVGTAPYNGKIVIDDVTLPAGSTLVTGPNPPWVCTPTTSPMTCTYPVTTLNPGAHVDLKLGFKPAPGWQGNSLRNCAAYDYQASGKPLFGSQQNDRACASIPICRRGDRDRDCQPPVEKRVDLLLKKRARSEVCSANGVCGFVIDVINNGTATYSGPLTVIDSYPGGAPASASFGPTPPWTCGPNGPGQFRCDAASITLAPGASAAIVVTATMPKGYRSDTVENCAEVRPIPGEGNLANNKACATERFPRAEGGQPSLRIEKTCGGALAGAAAASCRITVTNTGTVAPTGQIRVDDAATLVSGGGAAQVQAVTPDGADWNCGPVPANALSCQIPGAALTPGTSRHFEVTMAANGAFQNCARGSIGPAPGDDIVRPIGRACAEGGGGSTIRVEKTGDSECRPGQPCSFEITITNDGPAAFSGPVRIGDAIGIDGIGRLEGVAITSIDPPFGCVPEPATLPASCIANLSLGTGESHTHHVTVVLPNDGRLAALQGPASGQNCIGVLSPDTPVRGGDALVPGAAGGAGEGGKAYACHPFTIPHEVKNQCSQGLVLNSAGRCVCPPGTTFRNGQCSSGGGTTVIPVPLPLPVPPPPSCVLLQGQIRTEDGRCVCPRGTELRNGRCTSGEQPPPSQCTLLPGQYRNQDGDCVCRQGVVVNGVCKVVRKCTIRGSVQTQDGSCACPDGTHLDRKANACVPDKPKPNPNQCRIRGQVRNADGVCACPSGTEIRGNVCRPVRPKPQQCTVRGQVRTPAGDCVCPRGTELRDGACRRPQVQCAPGSRLVNGHCQPAVRRRCPVGTTGEYPNCVPVRRRPGVEFITPGLLLGPGMLQVGPRRPSRLPQEPNNLQ